MVIQKVIPFVDKTRWLKHLYTQLNKPTNQNSIKVPKIVKLTNGENVNIKLWGL